MKQIRICGVFMIRVLNDIRNAENPISNNKKIINTIVLLFLGIALGTFQNIWILVKLNFRVCLWQ